VCVCVHVCTYACVCMYVCVSVRVQFVRINSSNQRNGASQTTGNAHVAPEQRNEKGSNELASWDQGQRDIKGHLA
jgi:hypothetical protein